jgi:hypothetical protein
MVVRYLSSLVLLVLLGGAGVLYESLADAADARN